MPRPLFRPSIFQTIWLGVITAATIGGALYVRYGIIQNSSVGLACEGGLHSWTCELRWAATTLFNNSIFGYVAMITAVLNLIHPSIVLMTLGLFAGGLGVVLYNVALSALAAGLLILSLARPAPEPD